MSNEMLDIHTNAGLDAYTNAPRVRGSAGWIWVYDPDNCGHITGYRTMWHRIDGPALVNDNGFEGWWIFNRNMGRTVYFIELLGLRCGHTNEQRRGKHEEQED